MNAPDDAKAPSPFSPKLVVGVAIIVAGLVLTLDNLGLIEAHTILKLWPLVLVAIGAAKIRQERGGSSLGGWFLVLGGAFLLLFTFGHGHLADALGPMLVVAVGILIVVKALKQNRGVPPALARSEDFLQGTAILGGFKRRISTQAFKGGELTAIFGGYEVDLRQAVLETARPALMSSCSSVAARSVCPKAGKSPTVPPPSPEPSTTARTTARPPRTPGLAW